MAVQSTHSALFDQAAFTLLEVMISIVILAISLTTLLGSQSRSISLATETKFNTTASMLAGYKLAELESQEEEIHDDEGDFGDDFPDYRYRITVQDTDVEEIEVLQSVQDSLQQVDLIVTWGEELFSCQLRYYKKVKKNE